METKPGQVQGGFRPISFLKENQILLLLIGSVIVALVLTSVSLWLYAASGTQQLDLSRPGYKSVQDKVKRDPISDAYPAAGPMSIKEIEKFKKLFNSELKRLEKNNAFSGDPLSPEGLGLTPVEEATQQQIID